MLTKTATLPLPKGSRVHLPPLHPGQRQVVNDPARFQVLACGRRWGKTRLGAAMCLRTALHGGAAWWVAPSYKVAAVGWRLLRRMGQQIPGATVREGDRMVEVPGGGWLQVRSADDPDSLRGEGLDFLVMDECAFIQEAAWSQVLRPSLSDRKGSALFISTPKGMNWFWLAWERGQRAEEGEWHSWRFPTVSNPYIDPGEVAAAQAGLPERVFQQEYEATFLEDAGGVFRGIREVIDAGRTANEPAGSGCMLGVDLARVQDFTVLTVLDANRRQVYHERFNQISWERQIATITRVSQQYGRARIWLDSTGVGDPIFEALRHAQLPVQGYNLTNQSKEALIDALALAIENRQVRLMDLPTQTTELQAYQYELTPSRNVRMSAPEGMHDDCVIALALANWGLAGKRSIRIWS